MLAAAGAGVMKIAYIMIQAARGRLMHFNVETPLEAALYPLMGFGAVTLVVVCFFIVRPSPASAAARGAPASAAARRSGLFLVRQQHSSLPNSCRQALPLAGLAALAWGALTAAAFAQALMGLPFLPV